MAVDCLLLRRLHTPRAAICVALAALLHGAVFCQFLSSDDEMAAGGSVVVMGLVSESSTEGVVHAVKKMIPANDIQRPTPHVKPQEKKKREKPVIEKDSIAKQIVEEKKPQPETQSEPTSQMLSQTVTKGEGALNRQLADKTASGVHTNSRGHMAVDRSATMIYAPRPNYPSIARKNGMEGHVTLSVLVNVQGLVDDFFVKTSSGHSALDAAAVEAVKKWRFKAAVLQDRPVDQWCTLTVRFQLKD